MSKRKDPWKKIGRPTYEGVHLMPFDIEKRAVKHEFNRQRAIITVQVDLYCMAAAGLIPKGQAVALSGAASQSLTGRRSKRTAAAHCIPRQLLLGTQKVQELLSTSFPERGLALDALFGEADILPVNFNKADSLAEAKGLSEAFRFSSQAVISEAQHGGVLEYGPLAMAVRKAFASYKELGEDAFKDAIKSLDEKVGKIERSRVSHTIRTKELSKWKEQLLISRTYTKALAGTESLETVLEMGRVNGVIKIYGMLHQK